MLSHPLVTKDHTAALHAHQAGQKAQERQQQQGDEQGATEVESALAITHIKVVRIEAAYIPILCPEDMPVKVSGLALTASDNIPLTPRCVGLYTTGLHEICPTTQINNKVSFTKLRFWAAGVNRMGWRRNAFGGILLRLRRWQEYRCNCTFQG